MSVRDEFDAWQNQTHDKYGDWQLWQAAYAAGQESMRAKLDEQWNDGFDNGKAAGRKAGLEEAAKVSEQMEMYDTAGTIAIAIRALSNAD